jgi:DMSO/TMAO reductase YedYZ molybdopterin-dependent catalytic subunit
MDNNYIKSPDTERGDRIPPGQHLTKQWPILHEGATPNIDVSNWTLSISGLVTKERILDFEEFISLPRVRVFSDMHCVTGWTKLDNTWEGVSTTVISELAHVLPEAGFVLVHSVGGFTANLPLSDFLEPDALIAIKHNNETLTPGHGYPARLIVPRLYLWKSVKWVTGLEFVKEDKPGYWELRGYHSHGDPWKEERYGS